MTQFRSQASLVAFLLIALSCPAAAEESAVCMDSGNAEKMGVEHSIACCTCDQTSLMAYRSCILGFRRPSDEGEEQTAETKKSEQKRLESCCTDNHGRIQPKTGGLTCPGTQAAR